MELITKKEFDLMLQEEKMLSNLLFREEEFPVGFKTGIYDAVDIANRTYRNTSSIIKSISELSNYLGTFSNKNKNIEYGYYFILSYLHFLMDDKILSLMAIACITNSYKAGGYCQ